jgi:hypothetical protein
MEFAILSNIANELSKIPNGKIKPKFQSPFQYGIDFK